MKQFTLGLVAALATIATASDVHDLKQDTFDSFVQENNLVLAEFFAPWCGHCKALAPEYEEAATALKEKSIPLAKVDCTEQQGLCASYGVEGYPTLKVFRGKENHIPYGGARKAPAIISYMIKQALPCVSDVTDKTFEDFKSADKVVVIAYFDEKDSTSNATFEAVANTMCDTFLFGATSDAALATVEGVKQPGIILYKQFDDGKDVFDGAFNAESITTFAKTASVPLIGEIGPDTYANYMAAGLPLAYVFAETVEEREDLAKTLKPVAQKHKGKINIATIDAAAFGQHGENLNLEVGKWPAFAIQDTTKNQKFPMHQTSKLTEKNIGMFIDDFFAGKVNASVKSDPMPENNDGPVTIIVAHNFNDVVIDNDKDVLVEYYAPWCGHCKALSPKYDELGGLFSSFSNLVTIAKVDATTNDVPEEIAGFPTIKLYAAKAKDVAIEYTGSRTVEDLVAFIRDSGTHKIDVYTGNDTVMSEASSAASDATNSITSTTEIVNEATESAKVGIEDSIKTVTGTLMGGDDAFEDHDEL